jgi:hypothetical protein
MRKRYSFLGGVTGGILLVGALTGPVASWLQGPEYALPTWMMPDAVYLVAGAREQDRRLAAAVRVVERRFEDGNPWTGSRDPLSVLIGNDPVPGAWSAEDGAHLMVSEWAERKFRSAIGLKLDEVRAAATSGGHEGTVEVRTEIVPGLFAGTDGEMDSLSAYLSRHPEIRSIALVTSPYHVRRTAQRLQRHLKQDVRWYVTTPGELAEADRSPRVVMEELLKMTRDRAGLTRAPLVSRSVPGENVAIPELRVVGFWHWPSLLLADWCQR